MSEAFLGEGADRAIEFSRLVLTANLEANLASATLKLKVAREVAKGAECGELKLTFVDQLVIGTSDNTKKVYVTGLKTPKLELKDYIEVGNVKFSTYSIFLDSDTLDSLYLDQSGMLNVIHEGYPVKVPHYCLIALECDLGCIVTFDNFMTSSYNLFNGDITTSFLATEGAHSLNMERTLN